METVFEEDSKSFFEILFTKPMFLRMLHKALLGIDEKVMLYSSGGENRLYHDLAYTTKHNAILMTEHRITRNPNFPIRFLLQAPAILGNTKPDCHHYLAPMFFVFYTGEERWDIPDNILKLSDAFSHTGAGADLRLDVDVITEDSKEYSGTVLEDFFYFYKVYHGRYSVYYDAKGWLCKDAVKQAVSQALDCVIQKQGVIADFCRGNRGQFEESLVHMMTGEEMCKKLGRYMG